MLKLYSIFEWIAFFCSVLLLSKGVPVKYRTFILYMLAVVAIEYAGRWLAEMQRPNHILFSFACFGYTCFYFLTLRQILTDPLHRKITLRLLFLFCLVYLINILFIQQLSEFNSYSFIAGYCLLTICCTFYYREYIRRQSIVPVFGDPAFFIVSGYFVYAILTALLYTIHRYFAYHEVPGSHYIQVFKQINNIANVVLYFLLALSFIIIWRKKTS